jgi:hypothetical protein
MRQRIQQQPKEFLELVRPLLATAFPTATLDDALLLRIIAVNQDRLHALPDIVDACAIFLAPPDLRAPGLATTRS